MQEYTKEKTTEELSKIFMYTELRYLTEAFKTYCKVEDVPERLTKTETCTLVSQFEKEARERLLRFGRKNVPNLLDEDAIMLLLLRQKNVWEESAIKKFIFICTSSIILTSKHDVNVHMWLKRIERNVKEERNKVLFDLDKHRGIL